jgi:hypothetical protein
LLSVENCWDHFESFIQNLENVYGDEEFMDKEIIEAIYENPFQHQGEKIEDSCHYIQQDLQQNIVNLLAQNETDRDLNVEIHIPFPEFDGDIQILSDQDRDEDNQSKFSSFHSLPKYVFQEKAYQIHIPKVTSMETQSIKSTFSIEFQEISE